MIPLNDEEMRKAAALIKQADLVILVFGEKRVAIDKDFQDMLGMAALSLTSAYQDDISAVSVPKWSE